MVCPLMPPSVPRIHLQIDAHTAVKPCLSGMVRNLINYNHPSLSEPDFFAVSVQRAGCTQIGGRDGGDAGSSDA